MWSNNASTSHAYQYDVIEEQKELKKSLTKIEKRLAILVPNEKLKEQYESLQSAYEQYLALEALLYDGEDNE
jgi:DTW domain-containing protein YfiP